MTSLRTVNSLVFTRFMPVIRGYFEMQCSLKTGLKATGDSVLMDIRGQGGILNTIIKGTVHFHV